MNALAAEKADEAEAELQEVLAKLDPDRSNMALAAGQEAWTEYRRRHAEFRSRINEPTPGSIAPLLYASEMEKVTRARIAELEWYLTREKGDL
jgi:uncharacterized protein YecT (DUF1311 family)